ncbi:MAG: hypothetical protein QM811_07390 [Pirellulales bacterium]
MNDSLGLLSLVVFLPALAALILAFFPKESVAGMRLFALGTTLVVFVITAWMAMQDGSPRAVQNQRRRSCRMGVRRAGSKRSISTTSWDSTASAFRC